MPYFSVYGHKNSHSYGVGFRSRSFSGSVGGITTRNGLAVKKQENAGSQLRLLERCLYSPAKGVVLEAINPAKYMLKDVPIAQKNPAYAGQEDARGLETAARTLPVR